MPTRRLKASAAPPVPRMPSTTPQIQVRRFASRTTAATAATSSTPMSTSHWTLKRSKHASKSAAALHTASPPKGIRNMENSSERPIQMLTSTTAATNPPPDPGRPGEPYGGGGGAGRAGGRPSALRGGPGGNRSATGPILTGGAVLGGSGRRSDQPHQGDRRDGQSEFHPCVPSSRFA